MKEESPAAFTKTPPFVPRVAFIDGMPLLMKSESVTRWQDLVRFNFLSALNRFYSMGAKTVVLGFDVYSLVSSAKSITQANRSKKVKPIRFEDGGQLPNVIPVEYNDFMRNRAFKRRVIQLVIDYESCPILFSYDKTSGKVKQNFMVDIPPMGECDVKCTRWFRLYGDGIAHSVDGDFIPIALMEHESQLRQLADSMSPPVKMAVFRLEFGASHERSSSGKESGKRDNRGNPVANSSSMRYGA
jgi:hypothetical protein